jgi:predicted RNA binding protein YcfA (HicA-like mRNA interferase family)
VPYRRHTTILSRASMCMLLDTEGWMLIKDRGSGKPVVDLDEVDDTWTTP